jgi:uncharacterized protein YggE
MSRLIVVAALVMALQPSPAIAQTPSLQPPVIVTQGEATLKRAPDRAWVTVATETRDVKAAEARKRNAEAMTSAQGALKGAGVRPDAIRTTGYSLSPEFDWNDGRSILRGYVVRNQIEVRVDDLDRLADVLDAVNAARNVAISVTGPRFDLKDENAAQSEALRAAVEVALTRAQAIAAGAKRSLGQILRIEERGQGPIVPRPPMPMAMRSTVGQAEVATPITPGEIEVRAEVTVTVEIK